MKKIIIIATVLAVAVASIIVLYFKNRHDDNESARAENVSDDVGDGYDECGDCGCGGCGESEEAPNLSSYDIDIVVDDGNISQVASFASKFFEYRPFPFIKGDYDWVSISYGSPNELERFIEEHDNGSGKVFMSLFVQLYKNRAEYLSNGEFLRYIKLLAGLIPHETYVANGWDMMVRQLLMAYEDLAPNPGSFRKVYEVMGGYGNPASFYSKILPFVNNKHLEAFIMKKGAAYYEAGEVNQSAVVWAYSFWGRRYNENPDSIESIAAILRLLRDELYITPPKPIDDEDKQ